LKVSGQLLLQTTAQSPRDAKPQSYPWPTRYTKTGQRYIPSRFRYMEDWDLQRGETSPTMSIIPIDITLDA
jgi:hypothetical protein